MHLAITTPPKALSLHARHRGKMPFLAIISVHTMGQPCTFVPAASAALGLPLPLPELRSGDREQRNRLGGGGE